MDTARQKTIDDILEGRNICKKRTSQLRTGNPIPFSLDCFMMLPNCNCLLSHPRGYPAPHFASFFL
jgi:hypothetical protein